MAEELFPIAGWDSEEVDFFELKYREDMHLKNFYKAFQEFLNEKEYYSMYKDDKIEPYYQEAHLPNGMKEYRIRWRVYKFTPNSNVVYKFDLNWLVLACKDIQTVVEGQKMKIQNVEVEIKCWTRLCVKKKGINNSWLTKPFSGLFWNRWWKFYKDEYEDEAQAKTKEIQEAIKELHRLKSYSPPKENFHRGRGYLNSHGTKEKE
ncbi:hypothetical protein GOV05_02915 [Candidatus Woesearchaeota archaeon]|nr:hypothetical protein [Candidatus Woesearchaeota archaeon]